MTTTRCSCSVPPYHIAGVANLLSNTYLGRRIVYLDRFDAGALVRHRAPKRA